MGHITKHTTDMVSDTQADKYFYINDVTRQIVNTGTSKKLTLVKGDHNSEVFTFELQKVIEGHDMSQCNRIEVHYINIGSGREQSEGVYEMTDSLKSVSLDGKEYVTCEWLISRNATKYQGTLTFTVLFECVDTEETTDADGDVIETVSEQKYAWHSAPYTNITVLDSIDNKETVLEPYNDILEQWWAKIERVNQDDIYVITDEGTLINLTDKIDGLEESLSTFSSEISDEVIDLKRYSTTLNTAVGNLLAADTQNVKKTGSQEIEGQKTFTNGLTIGMYAPLRFETMDDLGENTVELVPPSKVEMDHHTYQLPNKGGTLATTDELNKLSDQITEFKNEALTDTSSIKTISIEWPGYTSNANLMFYTGEAIYEDGERVGWRRIVSSSVVEYKLETIYDRCKVVAYYVQGSEYVIISPLDETLYAHSSNGLPDIPVKVSRLARYDTSSGILYLRTDLCAEIYTTKDYSISNSTNNVWDDFPTAGSQSTHATFELDGQLAVKYAAHTDFTTSPWTFISKKDDNGFISGDVATIPEDGTYQIRVYPKRYIKILNESVELSHVIEGIVELNTDFDGSCRTTHLGHIPFFTYFADNSNLLRLGNYSYSLEFGKETRELSAHEYYSGFELSRKADYNSHDLKIMDDNYTATISKFSDGGKDVTGESHTVDNKIAFSYRRIR